MNQNGAAAVGPFFSFFPMGGHNHEGTPGFFFKMELIRRWQEVRREAAKFFSEYLSKIPWRRIRYGLPEEMMSAYSIRGQSNDIKGWEWSERTKMESSTPAPYSWDIS